MLCLLNIYFGYELYVESSYTRGGRYFYCWQKNIFYFVTGEWQTRAPVYEFFKAFATALYEIHGNHRIAVKPSRAIIILFNNFDLSMFVFYIIMVFQSPIYYCSRSNVEIRVNIANFSNTLASSKTYRLCVLSN